MAIAEIKCQNLVLEQNCDKLADAYCKNCQTPICKNHACVVGEKIVCCDCEKSMVNIENPNQMELNFYQSIEITFGDTKLNSLSDVEAFEQDFDGS